MKQLLLFLSVLSSSFIFSQEVCDNGIDDDGDGRIDLNDSECLCSTSSISSIIPNPSFETYTNCPGGYSQLYVATPWIQATQATSDYFNKCGFVLPALNSYPTLNTSYPNGDGIVGAVFAGNWKEYLGTTLLSTMTAGTSYQLTFSIGALVILGDGNASSYPISNYQPVNLTLYGCNNGSNIPVATVYSPNIEDTTWFEVGQVTYTPGNFWQEVTILFTPSTDINAIMLGAPEVLPPSYPVDTSGNNFPYFLFDNLLLNEASMFGVNITQNGSLCDGNLVLSANVTATTSGTVTYQWYHNGIAIVGATSPTYNISTGIGLPGNYAVKITDGATCYVSSSANISNLIPSPSVTVVHPSCGATTGSITVTSTALEYTVNGGTNWSTSPTFSGLAPGNYDVRTKSGNGCVSTSNLTVINAPVTNSPAPTISVTQPQNCSQLGTITITTVADLYSFDNGINWTSNNVLSNVNPGNYTIRVKNTTTGCTSLQSFATVNGFTNTTTTPTGNTTQHFCIQDNATISNLNVTGQNIIWYDAASGGNVLPVTTTLVNGTTYYASQTINTCESPIKLAVTAQIINYLPANNHIAYACDLLNDGSESINLTDYNDDVIANPNNYTIKYYYTLLGAQNNDAADLIPNQTDFPIGIGSTIVYVKVTDQYACAMTKKVTINLYSLPLVTTKPNYILCNNTSVLISTQTGYDSYLWSTGETTPAINATAPGNYSVTVTKNYGNISCSNSKDFTVKASNFATISKHITADWTNNDNSITIILTAGSIGDYEYSIDGINYQESNTFYDLPNGEYTIFVRDINGCGIVSEEVYLLMHPKFFTPNGDGYNDYWRIQFSENEPALTVKLFDRYGKFIKEFGPNSLGWDGTYLGNPAPSSDYWFVVTRQNGKEHRGHFTLKR